MGADPLITMAIWALGVFAVLATTWIQDRRERRRIEDIRDKLEVRMVGILERIIALEAQMKKEGK